MPIRSAAFDLLADEADALLTRLNRIKPFVLQETMSPAAAPPIAAQTAIDGYLARSRQSLGRMLAGYRRWLTGPAARRGTVAEAHRRFTFLRLQFNSLLTQIDIFADAITQRSEGDTGVWLGGLDVLAADALKLPGGFYEPPPVVCYLDRGHGAAIRRVRTRLPGGGANPVAIVSVPRERMIAGSGIGSSLAHEVGHQGAALLDLISSLRPGLRKMDRDGVPHQQAWRLYDRWISEILADFWSVATIGVGATLGLMGVVALPRVFVFRVSLDDPHPIPWIRVRLSCAMGEALYPDPQWRRLASIWEAYYPLTDLDQGPRQLFAALEATMPSFIDMLVTHRPLALRGLPLGRALLRSERTPNRLRAYFQAWRMSPEQIRRAPPSLAFAVISQARADRKLSPQAEGNLLAELLTQWAVQSAHSNTTIFAEQDRARGVALAT